MNFGRDDDEVAVLMEQSILPIGIQRQRNTSGKRRPRARNHTHSHHRIKVPKQQFFLHNDYNIQKKIRSKRFFKVKMMASCFICILISALPFSLFYNNFWTLQTKKIFSSSSSSSSSFDPLKKIHWNITQNYSFIQTTQELEQNKNLIKHWCLRGIQDPSCTCSDPMIPQSRHTTRHWSHAHHMNVERATQYEQHLGGVGHTHTLDVVFYGDSITEQWHGTRLGYPVPKKAGIKNVYEDLFSLDHGAKYNGLALGIAGDTVSINV